MTPIVLLTGCAKDSRTVSDSPAICSGLETPIDQHADSLLDHNENTPAQVLLSGTRVIAAYDAGCRED